MDENRELQSALRAADRASKAILEQYASFQAIADAPANITTAVDRLSQEIILRDLLEAFPGDAFSAEETTASGARVAGTGPRLWIVDPIDGTRGFARKNGEFSVMIALVENGHIAVGVVLEPAKGRLTYAVRGGGCWRRDDTETPVRCQVSAIELLAAATLVQSRSKAPTPAVRKLTPARVVETYSAGIKLAVVARGEAEVYVNDYQEFHDWDICAGQILVEEAGGTVTGLAGQQLIYGLEGAKQRFGVLATNGKLHESVQAKLATTT
jgi:3'(2'), 5'-bisphosphate nucleotidase